MADPGPSATMKRFFEGFPELLQKAHAEQYKAEELFEMEDEEEWNAFVIEMEMTAPQKRILTKKWKNSKGKVVLETTSENACMIQAFVQKPQWSGAADLVKEENNAVVERIIQDRYSSMDMNQVMHELVECGQSLRLALMAAGLNECRTPILELVIEYNESNANTLTKTRQMTFLSLKSLNLHKMVLVDFDNQRYEEGMTLFRDVTGFANEMVLMSASLEAEAELLKTKAKEVLFQTNAEHLKSAKMAEQLKKSKEKLKEDADKKEKEAQAWQEKMEEANKKEDKQRKLRKAEEDKIKQEEAAMLQLLKDNHEKQRAQMKDFDDERRQQLQAAQDAAKTAREDLRKATNKAREMAQTAVIADFCRGTVKIFTGGEFEVDKDRAVAEGEREDAAAAAEEARVAAEQVVKMQEAKMQGGGDPKEMQILKDLQEKQEMQMDIKKKDIEQKMQHAKDLQSKAAELEAEAFIHNKEMIQATAEMRKLLSEMDLKQDRITHVDRAVKALGICSGALSKVMIAFRNMKMFWQAVVDSSKALADVEKQCQMMAKRDLQNVRDVIYESAQGWAAMGLVNHRAHEGAKEVLASTDAIFVKLPDGQASLEQIQELVDEIDHRLANQALKFSSVASLKSSSVAIEAVA